MTVSLDHLVYATPNLAGTTAAVAEALGIEPTVGGSHVGRGTANTLLGLGDGAYLEIVGPDPTQPDPPHARPFGVDKLTCARLMTFAVRVGSMSAALASARDSGYDPGEAFDMQRATPDGGLLAWSLTSAPDWAEGVVPFLIDWRSSVHPASTIGATARLISFDVWHTRTERVQRAFDAIELDMTVHSGPPRLIAAIASPAGVMSFDSQSPDLTSSRGMSPHVMSFGGTSPDGVSPGGTSPDVMSFGGTSPDGVSPGGMEAG